MNPTKVGITITTDDDDTADAVLEFLEDFAKGDLRNFLALHDPLVKVLVDDSNGYSVWC